MAVSAATIRQDIYAALKTLMVNNKPTYTYNSATQTYTIVSAYPQDNPTFPCIVLNPSAITLSLITMDAGTAEYEVEVQLDFYAKELHGKLAIDTGQDEMCATFIGNISAFIGTDGLIPKENFWTDNPSSIFEDKNQVINTATSIVRFKLK